MTNSVGDSDSSGANWCKQINSERQVKGAFISNVNPSIPFIIPYTDSFKKIIQKKVGSRLLSLFIAMFLYKNAQRKPVYTSICLLSLSSAVTTEPEPR